MLSGDGGSGVDGIETVPPAPDVSDPELAVLVDRVESAVAELAGQASVSWTNADRRAVIQRMETLTRSVTAYSYTWLNELIAQHGLDVYPGSVPCSVAWMLRITPRTAGARVRLAAELGDRTALSGEVLPPLLPHTADALRAGLLDAQHVQMIREFFKHLPASVDPQTRDLAEEQLVGFASTRRPDDFAPLVANLDSILNPDGDHDEDEDEDEDGKPKPRKRRDAFFYLGEQGADGMSEGKFCVDPELRAYLEALFAKAAKPGVNNPADPTSVVHGETSRDETRSGSDEKGGSRSRGNGSGTAPKPEPSDASSSDAGLWHSNNCGSDGDCCDSECDCDDNCCDDNCCDEGNCGDESNCRDCGCGTEPDRSDDTDATDATDTDPDDAADPTAPGSDEPNTAVPDTAARDAAAPDIRTQNERRHDALKLALRHTLASGTLGTHRGLPVTAIITMTLKDLEAGCGYAKTATGSRVSIRDAIRMASHAHHYLTIFDDHGRALYLGRSKRIASADQRIMLIARDRGCSFPSCTRPATWCQAHHVTDWVDGGNTDIDGLTFGCDMHHALVGTGPNTWATTKTTATHRYPGRTLWHPPTGMDPLRRGLINHAHHPEEVLYPPDQHDDPGDEEPRQPA
ncbi:HNH endonuclease [Rhodococcus sp. ARC_M12]|uniref:HNH endonuclease signature motif containing protein n=1 Tax=Rhodococcus sp. ARC_M12 TaxID=2928854 RepID=UPI001FB2481B|nr:HNH endonuclease signature motif containing protein [Rhodococcus sp. ARC_M12]MCJ0979081.1 HNH endonuclease [Rhodococcus sp. ARC_M12]